MGDTKAEAPHVRNLLDDREFLAGTLASALLYGYARLTISVFAWSLGVQPGDLDVATEDYIFLAFIWIAFLAGAYLLFPAHQRSLNVRDGKGFFDDVGQWIFGILALGLLLWMPVLLLPRLSHLMAYSLFMAGPLLFGGVVYGVCRALSIRVLWTWVWLAGFMVFALVSGCLSAAQAGGGLKDDPPSTSSVPLPLRLLLPPTIGVADLNGSETCVVRVAPRVLVKADAVYVIPEPVAFRLDDCAPE